MPAPYNIDDTLPEADDIISGYPLVERTFRSVVKSWLTFISNPATGIINEAALPSSIPPRIKETIYTASGTHTFQATSTYFQIEAVGGGGGSGGVAGGGPNSYIASHGGGAGFWGKTGVLTRGAIATGTVTIGTAGAGGNANGSVPATAGGDTTWADGTNSFTWGGGRATLYISPGQPSPAVNAPATSSGVLYGFAGRGGNLASAMSSVSGDLTIGYSGGGGNSPFGNGGNEVRVTISVSTTGNGLSGSGYGSGGGGAIVSNTANTAAGGNGTGGLLIVREW